MRLRTCLVSPLVVGLISIGPAKSTEPPRTAFFCMMQDSESAGAPPMRHVGLLLRGTAETVNETDPMETFDPTGILEGETFVRFVRTNPAGGRPGYAIVTGPVPGSHTFLLSLTERDGGPDLDAGIGLTGTHARYQGRCIRYRSADTAADFERFKAEERH